MPQTVRPALVSAQHAHPSKSDRAIGADGALVVERGIDGEAVVAPFSYQPSDRRSECVAPETAALMGRGQADVQAGVAVVGVGLLLDAEPAGELTFGVDGEGRAIVAQPIAQSLHVEIARAPPLANPGAGDDRGELLDIRFGERPQGHAFAVEGWDLHGGESGVPA